MYASDEILSAAKAIRPHLTRLLGSENDTFALELDRLLDEAAAGRSVNRQVGTLLASTEATRSWTRFFLNGEERAVVGTVRGYAPPPGESQAPVPARLYACPEPDCTTVWRCRSAGQPIPRCPEHRLLVQPQA
jgi:hypothetical protein